MSYRDNKELLDKGGRWIYYKDTELILLEDKIGIGFLQDSHYCVVGLIRKGLGGSIGINGYACSHFRLLNKEEIKKYT